MHINVLEARALLRALEKFDVLRDSVVQPRVDNTSVIASVAKGSSKSADLSIEIDAIDKICKIKDTVLRKPIFIKSIDNIADHWSRIFEKERNTIHREPDRKG